MNRPFKYRWIVIGMLMLALGTIPLWGTDYILLFGMLYCLYMAMAQMWNLLAG